METILYIIVTLICSVTYIGAYSWYHTEDIIKVLPPSVIQLLDAEPLGLPPSTAFLVLLSSVVLAAWSIFSTCLGYKPKTAKKKLKQLRQKLLAQKRLMRLKEKELKRIKKGISQKQNDFDMVERKLLSRIREKEQSILANKSKVTEIESLKEKFEMMQSDLREEEGKWHTLEEEVKALKIQVTDCENYRAILLDDQRNQIEQTKEKFGKYFKVREEKHREKVTKIQTRQNEMMRENEEMKKQIAELQEQLKESQKHQEYESMCMKLEQTHYEYREKIRVSQERELAHWKARKHLERRIESANAENAAVRVMVADFNRKLKRTYRAAKKPSVAFKEDPQVVTYIKHKAPAKSIKWETLSHRRTHKVQETVYLDPSDLV